MIKTRFVLPADKEIVEAIVNATCDIYIIDRAFLFSDTSRQVAELRQYVYFLAKENTSMNTQAIADYLGSKRPNVVASIEKIKVQKKIYRQTIDSLRKIIQVANNFEKKHDWQFQSLE